MSALSRFRKPNGLLQLVRLVETTDPEKRTQLMQLIAKEDPGWAHMVHVKALTFERLAQWPDETLERVFNQFPAGQVAPLIQTASGTLAKKIYHSLPQTLVHEVDALLRDRRFSKEEKATAQIKLFGVIRELQEKGILIFSQFDPALDIDLRLAG